MRQPFPDGFAARWTNLFRWPSIGQSTRAVGALALSSVVAILAVSTSWEGAAELLRAFFAPTTRPVADFALAIVGGAAPVWLAALAFSIGVEAGYFNLGGDGQFLMGSFVAVWAAGSFQGSLAALVGFTTLALAAATWSTITAGLARLSGRADGGLSNASLVVTLLSVPLAAAVSEAIAGLGIATATHDSVVQANRADVVMTVPAALRFTRRLGDSPAADALWPTLICAALALCGYMVLWRSKPGLHLRASSRAPRSTLRRLGVSSRATWYGAAAISGTLMAIAGAGYAFSNIEIGKTGLLNHHLGFDGLLAAVIGRNKPVGSLLGALFVSFWVNFIPESQIVSTGALTSPLNQYVFLVAEGLVLFLVLARSEVRET